MLLTELLKKMQFRHNESQLQELDDESVDDDVCKLFIIASIARKSYKITAG